MCDTTRWRLAGRRRCRPAGNQENRDLAGEADRPEQQRRFRDAVNQPGLGDALHPGADKRNDLAAEEKLKISSRRARRVVAHFGVNSS